jgi:hypothetical protein
MLKMQENVGAVTGTYDLIGNIDLKCTYRRICKSP